MVFVEKLWCLLLLALLFKYKGNAASRCSSICKVEHIRPKCCVLIDLAIRFFIKEDLFVSRVFPQNTTIFMLLCSRKPLNKLSVGLLDQVSIKIIFTKQQNICLMVLFLTFFPQFTLFLVGSRREIETMIYFHVCSKGE